jgi:uncharacterized protein YheU (UPF0270 family)
MRVPHTQLPPDVLQRVLEDFVTRGGTDDGQIDATLEQRVAQVLAQLVRGEAALDWDAETESINIILVR